MYTFNLKPWLPSQPFPNTLSTLHRRWQTGVDVPSSLHPLASVDGHECHCSSRFSQGQSCEIHKKRPRCDVRTPSCLQKSPVHAQRCSHASKRSDPSDWSQPGDSKTLRHLLYSACRAYTMSKNVHITLSF